MNSTNVEQKHGVRKTAWTELISNYGFKNRTEFWAEPEISSLMQHLEHLHVPVQSDSVYTPQQLQLSLSPRSSLTPLH